PCPGRNVRAAEQTEFRDQLLSCGSVPAGLEDGRRSGRGPLGKHRLDQSFRIPPLAGITVDHPRPGKDQTTLLNDLGLGRQRLALGGPREPLTLRLDLLSAMDQLTEELLSPLGA